MKARLIRNIHGFPTVEVAGGFRVAQFASYVRNTLGRVGRGCVYHNAVDGPFYRYGFATICSPFSRSCRIGVRKADHPQSAKSRYSFRYTGEWPRHGPITSRLDSTCPGGETVADAKDLKYKQVWKSITYASSHHLTRRNILNGLQQTPCAWVLTRLGRYWS
jgi:hypothetical protein